MERYFTHELIHHLIYFQAVIVLVILSNIRVMYRTRRGTRGQEYPMVSVLIPARDEERNIAACVRSLLAQEYPNYEVLVLDDRSSDNTREILQELAARRANLHLLEGLPAPDGVIGKSWACTQLAARAKGQLLLFTDADTHYAPNALRTLVETKAQVRANLLTGYPRQIVVSWGEKLLVPFFTWAMMSFNSLGLAYLLNVPALASGVGQMMLFDRESYFQIGGHERVSSSIVEDLALARNLIASGLRWRVTYIADLIECRMYRNAGEARAGFTKNLFAVFDFRVLPYLFVFTWLVVLFWWPLILLGLKLAGQAPLAEAPDLLACIGLSILLWWLPYRNMRVDTRLALMYPVTILVITAVAYQSIYFTLAGKLTWKKRAISGTPWRWL